MAEFDLTPVVDGKRLINVRLSLTIAENTATWSAYDLTSDNPRGAFLAAQRFTHGGTKDLAAAFASLMDRASETLAERLKG